MFLKSVFFLKIFIWVKFKSLLSCPSCTTTGTFQALNEANDKALHTGRTIYNVCLLNHIEERVQTATATFSARWPMKLVRASNHRNSIVIVLNVPWMVSQVWYPSQSRSPMCTASPKLPGLVGFSKKSATVSTSRWSFSMTRWPPSAAHILWALNQVRGFLWYL